MKTASPSKPEKKLKQSAIDLLRVIPGYDPFANADGYEFDPRRAERALRFFEVDLTHIKGEKAGQPIKLEPWQQAIIANLFGWVDSDGLRRYRETLIYVPRKNGKSILAAGVGNYLLFDDGEPGAEIYCAAADREQAALLFDVAKQQVINCPRLAERGEPYKRSIALKRNASVFRVLSADVRSKHGQNTHGVLIDELHAQTNREFVDVLTTATGSRRQPLIVYLTTADFAGLSVCNEKLDYAKKVRDGIVIDPTFLPVVYETLDSDDWESEETWRKANPNLDVSISIAYLRKEFRKAKAMPTYENTFKRLHLNLQTKQNERWIQMPIWNQCVGTVDLEELAGQECVGGLDLASVGDITAFVLIFRRQDGYAVLPWFWAPEEKSRQRERDDRAPYLTWSRQGLLELTPSKWTDYDRIRAKIQQLGTLYKIREIAFDRWNASQLVKQLAGDGFNMVEFGQGYRSMSPPCKELERLLVEKKIAHGGNPVLTWMADNVALERDEADNWKPDRHRSREKIDGIVALVMAIGRELAGIAPRDSVYESRGVLSFDDIDNPDESEDEETKTENDEQDESPDEADDDE